MSTLNRTNLEIRVVDVDRHPVENATVLIPMSQVKTVGRGRFAAQGLSHGPITIRVEAKGYAAVDLSLELRGKNKHVDVVLGEPGLPTLRRRNVPIPFRSPDDRLGVIARGVHGT